MNNLLSVMGNILEDKGDSFNSDELFSVISLLTLNKILELYQLDKTENIAEGQLTNLVKGLTQQQGNDLVNNNNLQKMLPILLQLLGEGGNMNNIMKMMTNSNKKSIENSPDIENEEQPQENYKKKS